MSERCRGAENDVQGPRMERRRQEGNNRGLASFVKEGKVRRARE
jgi:hypothetical protein